MNIFIQLIGFVAWILIATSYYTKNRKNFIILQLISYILYSIHLYILGGFTGALANICGIITMFLILIKEKSKKPCYFILAIILALYILTLLVTYDGAQSFLPIFACLIPLLSNWQKNYYIIKIGGIIGGAFWFVYGILYGSYAAIITNIIFITITTISIIKQRKDDNNDRLQKTHR